MSPALRIGLVVLGTAMAVHGAASLTAGWLGTPPWWPQVRDPSGWFRRHPELWGEGREWIGLSLAIVGLALVLAAWPRRQSPPGAPPRLAARTPRVVGLFLGSVLTIYAVASLTGAWLGEPPWWRTRTAPAELQEFWARQGERLRRAEVEPGATGEWVKAVNERRAKLEKNPSVDPAAFRVDGVAYVRPGREWISGAVVVAGLALVAVGAWPRQRRAAS